MHVWSRLWSNFVVSKLIALEMQWWVWCKMSRTIQRIDQTVITICYHQNTSLFLHRHQFWDDQIMPPPTVRSNVSKHLLQSNMFLSKTMLWPSYGQISNFYVFFLLHYMQTWCLTDDSRNILMGDEMSLWTKF